MLIGRIKVYRRKHFNEEEEKNIYILKKLLKEKNRGFILYFFSSQDILQGEREKKQNR